MKILELKIIPTKYSAMDSYSAHSSTNNVLQLF